MSEPTPTPTPTTTMATESSSSESASSDMWNISIKTVGKNPSPSNTTHTHNESQSQSQSQSERPREFTVTTSPSSTLVQFRKNIQSITGLDVHQQRLIYRGRLLADTHTSGGHTSGAHGHGHGGGRNASASSTGDDGTDDGDCGTKLCDVDGLEDGHTIHLVPRPSPSPTADNTNGNTNDNDNDHTSTSANANTNTNTLLDNPDNLIVPMAMGMGGAGLLSALLTMGREDNDDHGNDNDNDNGNGNDNDNGMPGLAELAGSNTNNTNNTARSNTSASTRPRRRPNSHRRVATDARFQDPCPLEPLRQGLMTLHTMMGSHGSGSHGQDNSDSDGNHNPNANQASQSSPLDANRWWYRGQWLDVRDTVNQWLEATVVEVMTPDDILIRSNSNSPTNINTNANATSTNVNATATATARSSTPVPAMDSAIGANEHEGRIRLLLEPSSDPQDSTLADINHNPSLIGFTERKHNVNDNIQLLLIHYNGWPHRWDEWIRSDSERIRPFRTRSRHVPGRNYCPLPESTFLAAPSTCIRSDADGTRGIGRGTDEEEEVVERGAVLPELFKALEGVQDIFAGALRVEQRQRIHGHGGGRNHLLHGVGVDVDVDKAHGNDATPKHSDTHTDTNTDRPLSQKEQRELSSALQELRPEMMERVLAIVQGENEGGKDMDPSDIDVAALDCETQWKLKTLLLDGHPHSDHLELDSNGKELVQQDRNLPWESKYARCDGNGVEEGEHEEEEEAHPKPDFDKEALKALAPLLDRLGRILIDAAPHVATLADSLPEAEPNANAHSDTCTGNGNDNDGEHEEHEHDIQSNADDDDDEVEHTEIDMDADADQSQSRELRPSWSHAPVPSLFESESDEPANVGPGSGPGDSDDVHPATNPDYVDFVHGFINHRSNSSSPRRGSQGRNRSDGTGSSIGSSLISSFLASALRGESEGRDRNGRNGGPRVVRVGGRNGDGNGNGGNPGNGNGIDIHIHAIVTGGNGIGGDTTPDFSDLAEMVARTEGFDRARPRRNNVTTPFTNAAPAPRAPTPAVDEEDMGLFEELYSENPSERGHGPDESWRTWTARNNEVEIEDDSIDHDSSRSVPGLMSRNESDSSSDDDNSIPGLVHRDHVSINSSDETDADDNAPNLNGYNSESESESSVPGLIDRAVSDSSDDSDTGSVNYALLHPPRHLLHPPRHLFGVEAQPPAFMNQRRFFVQPQPLALRVHSESSSDDSDSDSNDGVPLHPFELQSESSEASETEAETDDSSDSSNNNDAQHSDFVDMESAERQSHVPSEDTNDGHHCDYEDTVADAGGAGALLIGEELPPQEDDGASNYIDAVESDDDDDDELESLPALFSGNEDPLQEHENEDETRSIPQDDASFHGTNDDSMPPVAINTHDTEENDVVVEEEAQRTDTARLLRSFFRRTLGRNSSH